LLILLLNDLNRGRRAWSPNQLLEMRVQPGHLSFVMAHGTSMINAINPLILPFRTMRFSLTIFGEPPIKHA
jgi:hypothetical protein